MSKKNKNDEDDNKLTITAKIQIKVSDQDVDTLLKTMRTYADACNVVSEHIFNTHILTYKTLNNALYYGLREQFGLGAQMAQSVIKTVIAKYSAIKEQRPGEWIKPEFKKLQMDLVWNRDYSLTKGLFSVNTLSGRIKTPYYSKAMEQYFDHNIYKFGTAKVIYRPKVTHKNGKTKKKDMFYLHIPVTFEIEKCGINAIQNVVGVDRGINFPVVTYDINQKSWFVRGGVIKQKRSHYKNLRSELQKRQTPSARRRLKSIGNRENRWMNDLNHCITKALVENNPKGTIFVLEDLTGIRSVTEVVKVKDRYVQVSWAFYDLEQKLAYKALRNGSMVIKVDPRYTSQECPICGHTAKNNRDKKNHRFQCKNCGYQSNDDRIGAMNVFRKGIEYLIDQIDLNNLDTVA